MANSLLAKCNIDLHVTDISACGAKVFISLYESVLGEKVPGKTAMSCLSREFLKNCVCACLI